KTLVELANCVDVVIHIYVPDILPPLTPRHDASSSEGRLVIAPSSSSAASFSASTLSAVHAIAFSSRAAFHRTAASTSTPYAFAGGESRAAARAQSMAWPPNINFPPHAGQLRQTKPSWAVGSCPD